MKPGDLVRPARKITPYNAPQEGSKHTRPCFLLRCCSEAGSWHTIRPGDVGMLVERLNSLNGLFLFGEARVVAHMEMFEVLEEACP